MSEDADYSRSSWVPDHDFSSARKAYDTHAGRSYDRAVTTSTNAWDLLPEKIFTRARRPLIVITDETGSMGDAVGVIISKWPYLGYEAKEYLGEDAEICVGAIGDAYNNESYPLQMRPFAMGKELEAYIKELVHEKKGGNQTFETYELALLYILHNCEMLNAINPIVVVLGDEHFYPTISVELAKQFARVDLQTEVKTLDVIKELRPKCALYFVQLPYSQGSFNSPCATTLSVYKQWSGALGVDHVVKLPVAERVVDVIFGILAKETGKVEYFYDELTDRQSKDKDGAKKIQIVTEALETVHVGHGGKLLTSGGHSTMHKPLGAKSGKRFLLTDGKKK